ncbi:gamma-glutamylaminecyclotransferase [Achlya hypogyna]|uniref:Gamma-glutamylcyclotransferase family protein n=1 Tax=Achlya hypogyna TaxID=1202772 RepID=A0A1V9ZR50_ACHHY|nr:gamma-glutamylaminecyclotransferase [Achlya hypogyna]
MTDIFVYGTLKRGFFNHDVYLKPAQEKGKATFRGEATTAGPFPLVVGGDRCVPFLLDIPGEGVPITGELYTVDDACLQGLDILEAVASGYYKRVKIPVILHNETIASYVYMRNVEPNDPLLELPTVPCYTLEAAKGYSPRTEIPNLEILALIYDIEPHRLPELEMDLRGLMGRGLTFNEAWKSLLG